MVGTLGISRASFGGVIAIIQPDANQLGRTRNRRQQSDTEFSGKIDSAGGFWTKLSIFARPSAPPARTASMSGKPAPQGQPHDRQPRRPLPADARRRRSRSKGYEFHRISVSGRGLRRPPAFELCRPFAPCRCGCRTCKRGCVSRRRSRQRARSAGSEFQRRLVTLCAWLIRLPNWGPRPHTSHTFAIIVAPWGKLQSIKFRIAIATDLIF